MAAAKGELKREETAKEPTPPAAITPFPVREATKRREERAKSERAGALGR